MDKYLTPDQEAASLTTRPERLEELANDYKGANTQLTMLPSR